MDQKLSVIVQFLEDKKNGIQAIANEWRKMANNLKAQVGIDRKSFTELSKIAKLLETISQDVKALQNTNLKINVDTQSIKVGEEEMKKLTQMFAELKAAIQGIGKGTTNSGVDNSVQKYQELTDVLRGLVSALNEIKPLLSGVDFSNIAQSITTAAQAMKDLEVRMSTIGQSLSVGFSQQIIKDFGKIQEEAKKTAQALNDVEEKKQSNAKHNFTKEFSVADAAARIREFIRLYRESTEWINRFSSSGLDTTKLEAYRNRIKDILKELKIIYDSGGRGTGNYTTAQFMASSKSHSKELRELTKDLRSADDAERKRLESLDRAKAKLHELGEKQKALLDLQSRKQALHLDTSQVDAALQKLGQVLIDLHKIETTGTIKGQLFSDYMGRSDTRVAMHDANVAQRQAQKEIAAQEKRNAEVQRQADRNRAERAREAARIARETAKEESDANRQRLRSIEQLERKLTSLAVVEQRLKTSKAMGQNSDAANAVKAQLQAVQNLIAAYEQLKRSFGGMTGMQFKNGNFTDTINDLNRQMALLKQSSSQALSDYNRSQRMAQQGTHQLTTRQQVLTNAMQQVNQAANSQSMIMSDLRSMAAQYVSIWGATNFVKEVAQVTGELELQRKSLEVIIGNASYARELYNDIRDLSQQSPYNFQDLMKSTRQLAAFGVQTKDLYSTMKSLSDIGAGLSVDVSRLILAYGHTKSYGYLSGIQNRQFETAGIDLVGALADRYNKLAKEAAGAGEAIRRVSRKDVFKMIHDKEVQFEDVEAVIMDLDKPGGKFYNMQERQYDTLGGKLRNLRNNYTIMLSEIGESHKGILKWGVEGLNELTANWEKYANVLAMVLVPMAALKLSNMALTNSLTRQSRQVVTNMNQWVKQQHEGTLLARRLKKGNWSATMSFLGGLWPDDPSKKWSPTKAEKTTFRENLQNQMKSGQFTKKDAIRLGFSRTLPKELREIALGLGGVDKATQKTILSGNALQRTWMRIHLGAFNLGSAIRAVGRALKSLVTGFLQLAPMMAIMAIFEHVSKVKSDAEAIGNAFKETGANDRKELADLLQRYEDQFTTKDDKLVNVTRSWNKGISQNLIKVDKEKLRSLGTDLSDEIKEIQEKLQAMDPLVNIKLVDITSMQDQYDQFEALLKRIEQLRRVNAAKEDAASVLEKAVEESAGPKKFWVRWNDDVKENMQEGVNAYNDMIKGYSDLTGIDIKQLDEDWAGFISHKADVEHYERLEDALEAIVNEFGAASGGAMDLDKAIDDFAKNSGKSVNTLSNIWSKLSKQMNNSYNDMHQARKDIKTFGKELASIARSRNFVKFEAKTDSSGNTFSKLVDDPDQYAAFIKEEIKVLQQDLKGSGRETGYLFTKDFVDSTLENLHNYNYSEEFMKELESQLRMDLFLPKIQQVISDMRIDTGKTYSEDEITKMADDAKQFMIERGGDFKEIGEKYAEYIIRGFRMTLKVEGQEDTEKELEDWQKTLIRQIEGNELDVELTTKVKNKLIKDVKETDDLKTFWQEKIKKEYDAAKSYIESQDLLIKNTVTFDIGTQLNFGDVKQLTDLKNNLTYEVTRLMMSPNMAGKDNIPTLKALIDSLDTFIALSALADKNYQNIGQGKARQDYAKAQEEKRKKAEALKKKQEQEAEAARKKAEAERKKREQEAKRAADEARHNEHARQREMINDYRERIRVIKDARAEYENLIKDGYDEADALKTIKDSFGIWFTHGILKPGDLDDLENYQNAINSIINTLSAEKNSLPYHGHKEFEDIDTAIEEIIRDGKKLDASISRDIFKEKKDDFLSKVEKDLDDLQRAWKMFEDVLSKTGDYDLATKYANREIGNPTNAGDMLPKRYSDLIWNKIYSKSLDLSQILGDSYNPNLEPELFRKGWVYEMTDKELEKYVKDVLGNQLNKITDADERNRKANDVYAMTESLVKMLKAWQDALRDEKASAKEMAAELIGGASYIGNQRAQIEKDYKETVRKISLRNEHGDYYIPDENKQAEEQARAKRDYELFLLSDEYQRYMNSVETLTVSEVRDIANFIRIKLEEALKKGVINAETYNEQNQQVNERLMNNLPYNLPFAGNGRNPIYQRVGGWFFDQNSERNKNAVTAWNTDVSRRLSEEYGKKTEEQDQNLITALEILSGLLSKILSGTATQKDRKTAGELGDAIANWNNISDTKRDNILYNAKVRKEENDEAKQQGKDEKKTLSFADAIQKAIDALQDLKDGLDFFAEFFDSLGMEDASNAVGAASTVVGGALQGASALSSLGPYGMAAGAALGTVMGIAQAGDAKRQRQIEALRRDVQQIDNTLNLIKNLRESSLGYDTGQRRKDLAAFYKQNVQIIKWAGKEYSVQRASSSAMEEYYMRGGTSGNGYVQELEALKKQREDYLEMYDKENGKKKKSKEDLEEYKSKVAELDIQIMEYTQNLAKELWSIDLSGWASQIGDALMTAFENGTNAAEAFRDSVQDIMRSVVKSMMIKGIIEPMFEKLQDKLFGENGVFDINDPKGSMGATLAVLTDFFKTDAVAMTNAAQEFYNGANNIMEQTMGYGMDAKDSSKNTTSSLTSTASEETMGIVAGYLSTLRQDVGVMRILESSFINESWPSYIDMVTSANDSLTTIDRNTERIMVMLQDGQGALFERVDRISRRMDNITTGIDRVYTR